LSWAVETQAFAIGSHVSVVHATPSEGHVTGVPATHPFAVHFSVPLQNLPSEHAPSKGKWVHVPVGSLQLSIVQPTLSTQFTGVPATHPTNGLHVSLPSQAAPSSQNASFVACVHAPVAVLHESLVHVMPSSQLTGVPG